MGLKVVNLGDDIEPCETRWLWYPYIPADTLSMISGDPGVGKSWVVASLAAVISAGGEFYGQPIRLPPQRVLLASTEDGIAETLVPRLLHLGADLGNIDVIPEPFSLSSSGLRQLEDTIKEHAATFVVIDPLFNYIGGHVDTGSQNEVGVFMHGLRRIANRSKSAIVVVRHLRKEGARAGKELYSGIGSIGFTAAIRSEMLVKKTRSGSLVFKHIKVNNAPLGPTLEYRIDADDAPEKRLDAKGGVLLVRHNWAKMGFRWVGEYFGEDEADGTKPKQSRTPLKTAQARKLLLDELSQGPQRASDLQAKASGMGISMSALKRARTEVATTEKRVDGWYWMLREGGPVSPPSAPIPPKPRNVLRGA